MFRTVQQSLSQKILLMTAATMVVLLGLSSMITSRDHHRMVLELERRTTNNSVSLVYNTLLFSMVEGEMDDLQKILQNAVETSGIESLRVTAPDGVIRYSGQAGEVGQPVEVGPLSRLVRRGATTNELIEERAGNGMIAASVPLHNGGLCIKCHSGDGEYLGAIVMEFDFADIDQRLARGQLRETLVMGGSVLLVVAVMYLCLRLLVLRPLYRVVGGAQAMAAGDLSLAVEVPGTDEMAQLGGHLNTMRAHLRKGMEESTNVAEALAAAVEELDRSSENLVTISMEQSSGAAQQVSAVQEATATSEQIAATSNEISANVESVEQVAEETYNASIRGREAVAGAIEGMGRVKQKVDAIADAMLELGKKTQKIGGIADIVDELSEQTHLLALNAAIEAAGAAEHGKRFGVVAAEIRRLAERTVEATAQIRGLVEEIQDSTNDTVLTTEKGTAIVTEASERVDKIGDSLEGILSLVRQTKESSKEITVATQQQATAGEQMVVTITDINDVAVQINRQAEQVERSVIRLKDLARNLKDLAAANRSAQAFRV